jgi:hypothetical protein
MNLQLLREVRADRQGLTGSDGRIDESGLVRDGFRELFENSRRSLVRISAGLSRGLDLPSANNIANL